MLVILLFLFQSCYSVDQMCDQPQLNLFSNHGTFQLNNSCPEHSHCLPNHFCSCDIGYIGSCNQTVYRMENQKEVTSMIDDQKYTLFEVIGDPQQYTLLSFNLCHEHATGMSEFIDIWRDDGKITDFSRSTTESNDTYSIREGCVPLTTPFLIFGTKSNGQTEGFILGLKLAQPGSVEIKLTVTIQTADFLGLMFMLLLIIGGFLLITMAVAIGYMLYLIRIRRLHLIRQNQPNNISHFDKHMPRIKLTHQEKQLSNDDICSVCLLRLDDKEWLRKTICGHLFHQDCLDEWCKNKLSCPVCRRSLEQADLKEEPSTVTSQTLRQRLMI